MPDTNALENCPLSGGAITIFRGKTEVTIGARSVAVHDSHERCDACGEGFYAPGQLQRLEREAAILIRAVDAVVWLAEARAFRESLQLEPLTDRNLRAARQAGRA